MDDSYVKVDVSVAGVGSEVVDDRRVKAEEASFADFGLEGVVNDPSVKIVHTSVSDDGSEGFVDDPGVKAGHASVAAVGSELRSCGRSKCKNRTRECCRRWVRIKELWTIQV